MINVYTITATIMTMSIMETMSTMGFIAQNLDNFNYLDRKETVFLMGDQESLIVRSFL